LKYNLIKLSSFPLPIIMASTAPSGSGGGAIIGTGGQMTMRPEIKNNLKTKAKTEKDKETVKPTVINDRLIQ
jgi:hypothetical protein